MCWSQSDGSNLVKVMYQMHVISHRGYWMKPEEMNTEEAFRRSFSLGFGTETDIRDCKGRLVISHDPPNEENKLLDFCSFLSLYLEYGSMLPLALNVKSDGLQDMIRDDLREYNISNYVLFDMSIPDLLATARSGLKFLTRVSDLEPQPILIDRSEGVWLDGFFTDWVDAELIRHFLSSGKKVFIVSSELHGRAPESFWENFMFPDLMSAPNLFICSDRPEHLSRLLAIGNKK